MVYAASYPVDSAAAIIEGMWVKLNSSGNVVLAVGASGELPLGLSGDTKSTSTSGIPSVNDSSVGPFVNRVSDSFDETKASAKISVYTLGEFFTNQYVTTDTWAVNDKVYSFTNGKSTNQQQNSGPVLGYVTVVPTAYDSGVPGTDTTNGSISLGNYLGVRLAI